MAGALPTLAASPSAFFSTEFLTAVAANLVPALFPFLLAAATTVVLTPLAIVAGRAAGIVAQPGGRHIHVSPTPKLGGVALFAGFAVAVALYVPGSTRYGILTITGIATALFVLDDRFQLHALLKLAAEVALALAAMLAFGYLITYFTLPGLGELHIGLLAYPLTLFWLVGMQNTVNLLDGVDGLAAGVVGIVAVVLGVAAVTRGQYDVTLMAFALGGACLGFLAFNFNPARIFMGDSGSHFLGLALGLLSIVGVAKVAVAFALVIPVVALAVPILDTAWAIFRRRRQRVSIAHADTRHIHHQLLDFGLDQRQTCLVFYGATGILGALGLMLFGHKRILAVAIVIVIVGLSTLLGEWLESQPWRLPAPGLGRLLEGRTAEGAAK